MRRRGAVESPAAAARQAHLVPMPTDLADVLWLATRMGPVEPAPEAADPPDRDPDAPALPESAPSTADWDPAPVTPESGPSGTGPVPAEAAEFDDPDSLVEVRRRTAEPPQVPELPFRAPAAPALARLKLARALRPFKRRVPVTGGVGELDADATAHEAARAIPHAETIDYQGSAHGLFATDKERLIADLLGFLVRD